MIRIATLFIVLTASVLGREILDLDTVLTRVNQNNAKLSQSQLTIRQAALSKDQSKNKRFGQIDLQAGYTRYDSRRTLAPMAPPVSPQTATSEDITTATIKYSVVLFDGFQTPSDVALNEVATKQAELIHTQNKARMHHNAAQLYYKTVSLARTLQSTQAYIKSLKLLRKNTQHKLKQQTASKLNLLKVKNRLSEQKRTREQLKYALSETKAGLALLMGRDDISFDLKKDPAPMDLKTRDTTSVQVQQARLQKNKADKEVTKAKSSYFPKLSFETFHTDSYGDSEHESFYQGGLYLHYNLFDFGIKSARLQKAKLQKLKAASAASEQIQEHRLNIIKAKAKIKQNNNTLALLRSEYELAKKIAKAEKIKYQNGAATVADLLQYQAKRTLALAKLHEARYELKSAKSYLHYLKE